MGSCAGVTAISNFFNFTTQITFSDRLHLPVNHRRMEIFYKLHFAYFQTEYKTARVKQDNCRDHAKADAESANSNAEQ